jgi:hypothetical protein
MTLKRPPLSKPEPEGKPLLHVVRQEELTDEMASLMTGWKIAGLTVGLGADNRLYLKLIREDHGALFNRREERNVTLVFNEYGIGVDK